MKKSAIKRKLKPLEANGQPHITESIIVGHPRRQLPSGTLVRGVVYYGPRGPREADFSIDDGESWERGTYWIDFPLSDKRIIRYV